MLFHYNTTGDDRLARQAIVAFAASAQPDGVLHGRYPAQGAQIITNFSLFWVMQVCDHHLYFGDDAFASSFTATIDGVLALFARHVGSLGLVEGLPRKYWNFIDWHPDWNSPDDTSARGTPVSGRVNARWTYVSLLYTLSLQRASALMVALGRQGLGHEYSSRAAACAKAVREHCFDGRFYTDTNVDSGDGRSYSQHCQVMAVLANVSTDPKERRDVVLQTIATSDHGPQFAKCSLMLQHFVFRALAEVGQYESQFHEMWEPWREMLALDLTTWAEGDIDNRSDCHAWSSLPLYEFPVEVCGLRPREPAFNAISFQPRVTLYETAHFTVPLGARGVAQVKWERLSGGPVHVTLCLDFDTIVYVKQGRREEECIAAKAQVPLTWVWSLEELGSITNFSKIRSSYPQAHSERPELS